MVDPSDEPELSAVDRWDRLMRAMGAEPRRLIVASLVDAPDERRLPLPEAANSTAVSLSPKQLTIQLRHHHLPVLADAGYVKWLSEPFCVQRGANFSEVGAFTRVIFDAVGDLPEELIVGCEGLEGAAE